ncbi:hypothetical protein [Geobacillus icigianus]|uniref:hypothetical protein n=1 Tax=Geobacillus icigianus TaxID=1430331 RepID=UPI0013F4A4CE|nr:hypothetical protein [Geobacillus icigianus]
MATIPVKTAKRIGKPPFLWIVRVAAAKRQRQGSGMPVFHQNVKLTWDFHPRVEGKPLPMDLFCENAGLTRIFIPGWRANHCPWIFSVKMQA